MTAEDNSINRILICFIIAGFLHLLILLGVSVPTSSVSDNSIKIKIKWAPGETKEKRKKVAESLVATKIAQKKADVILDNQNASSSTQSRKTNNFFFEDKDLAKRVAKIFQQSSLEKQDTWVNEEIAPVVLSYLSSWDRKCERLGRSNFGLNQPKGFLTIELTLLSDGRLKRAQVVNSSRVTKLDKHALKTVERAAPHIPFPPEMRKIHSELTFQRTWQYGLDGTTVFSG